MMISRNSTEALPMRQHLPVSKDVQEKQAKAIVDKRPAFVHGNTLVEQTKIENEKKKASNEVLTENFKTWVQECRASPEKKEPIVYDGLNFELNEKAKGWLRYQYRRCTNTKNDDWSINGKPHEWWDGLSGAPMTNFQRFDLHESSYFFFLIADKTPAWREVYTKCLNGLTSRYSQFWAAVDWNTQFGEDPDWEKYLPGWNGGLIPKHLFGTYNTPGWTANGLKHPLGYNESIVQGDPLNSNANLFFRGWMGLVMGINERVSGDGKWNQLWHMEGVDGQKFAYTYRVLEENLSKDFCMNNGKGLN